MEMKWENRWIHVSFFYYEKTQFGFAQHKSGEKHMSIAELCELIDNKEAVIGNKKMLAGLNGALVEKWDGKTEVFQLCGWNGNVGMYCYLVDSDGKLHRG